MVYSFNFYFFTLENRNKVHKKENHKTLGQFFLSFIMHLILTVNGRQSLPNVIFFICKYFIQVIEVHDEFNKYEFLIPRYSILLDENKNKCL